MDIAGILEAEDRLFNENRAEEVEGLLIGAISVALDEQDGYAMLSLLNELIGYYRETSRYEDAYKIATEIETVAGQILPEKSVQYATSLLNIATAYRAGGRLEDALAYYKRVEVIYDEILEPDSMLMASLRNNESLLYQEMGAFEESKKMLEVALKIVVAKGEHYEEAVTRANLAGTCMQLGELDEGYEYAAGAIELFNELDVTDGHFAAALSALGSYYYIKGEFAAGAQVFKTAMLTMETSLGRNGYYERLKANYEACIAAMEDEESSVGDEEDKNAGDSRDGEIDKTVSTEKINTDNSDADKPMRGMDICREYYFAVGASMLADKFSEYLGDITVGLAGEGSDCYGYDDEISRDHDWGPEFCMWVSDEVYEKIGEHLEKAYAELPAEYKGYKRSKSVQGAGRRGVIKVSDYCKRLLGTTCTNPEMIREEIDWRNVSDAGLSAFVNGDIWSSGDGVLVALREKITEGYPESIRYAKLAESCALFSQAGQYNYNRCLDRGDMITADIMKADACREAMKILYYVENKFAPHDKWLLKGIESLDGEEAMFMKGILALIMSGDRQTTADSIEKLGTVLAMAMYKRDIISDVDSYLDHHTEELMMKSIYACESDEELTLKIAKVEFAAFDKVKNEGGRASCQNDWPTFGIMRRSQYLTWNRTMLLQYLYDFEREMRHGHNLITEKYGRMMQSTAPEKYEEIKKHFPELTDEKKAIIEAICEIQVGWMEEFSAEYPKLSGKARTVHTYDDKFYDTSYETYLRGEISTYSDKMLELYARFIVGLSQENKNLARMTMENSCRLYGYESLEDAERQQVSIN